MEQWSIISNMLNYIQYDRHSNNYHNLVISTVNKYRNKLDIKGERDMIELDRSKNNKIKAEESFPISEQGYTLGKLLDQTECQILLDTGASKLFMSKSYYM